VIVLDGSARPDCPGDFPGRTPDASRDAEKIVAYDRGAARVRLDGLIFTIKLAGLPFGSLIRGRCVPLRGLLAFLLVGMPGSFIVKPCCH
jgi:hypothetical protein